MNSVIYVSNSRNSKIAGKSQVDTTYASIKGSCPNSCPIKNNGCYAQLGPTGIHVARIDKVGKDLSALQVARDEAKSIDASYDGGPVPAGRMMRLHAAGDSRTIKGTRLIANAINRWQKRGGGTVYNYTHAWRTVPRKEWKNVSVLASISFVSEVVEARKQGYAPAIMVPEHPSDKAYKLKGSKIKWIPCPAQTKDDVACTDCKLCMNADRLFQEGFGIAFAAHGVAQNKIKRHLTVLK